MLLLLLILIFIDVTCMCVPEFMYEHHVFAGVQRVRRGHWMHGNWSYRHLGAAWCRCWDPNPKSFPLSYSSRVYLGYFKKTTFKNSGYSSVGEHLLSEHKGLFLP